MFFNSTLIIISTWRGLVFFVLYSTCSGCSLHGAFYTTAFLVFGGHSRVILFRGEISRGIIVSSYVISIRPLCQTVPVPRQSWMTCSEAYWSEILPHVSKDFDSLDDDVKQLNTRQLNFFCALHVLMHVAEAAERVICEPEKAHLNGIPQCSDWQFLKPNETGTTRFVYTFCKLFARGADEKRRCHRQFTAYILPVLKQQVQLAPSPPSSWQPLFLPWCCLVSFFRQHALEFLAFQKLGNRLCRAVKAAPLSWRVRSWLRNARFAQRNNHHTLMESHQAKTSTSSRWLRST